MLLYVSRTETVSCLNNVGLGLSDWQRLRPGSVPGLMGV